MTPPTPRSTHATPRPLVRTATGRGRCGPVESCAKRMGIMREAHGNNARSAWESSSPHGLHDPALVALPVAVLLVGALVVLLLALRKADFELGPAFLPIELQRHDGVSAPLDRPDHVIELAPVEQ